MHKSKNKAMLIILDGWGIRKSRKNNAIMIAATPNFDRFWKENPHTTLHASEGHVGLPAGFIGNSEVGHMNIGAGRKVPQELAKLNKAIRDKTFFSNNVLLTAMGKSKMKSSSLHIMGLLSDGGVHSHINHLFAILKMAKMNKVPRVYLHCFLDGRDKPPKSAGMYIRMLENECRKLGIGEIVTIMGRFYAMDRDNRWNREHKAYDAMVNAKGRKYGSALEALKDAYNHGETDEFVKPSIILSSKDEQHNVKENDSIIFFNFREDRAREITRAFVQGKFRNFKRRKILNLYFACLTQYDHAINAPVAFIPEIPPMVLGPVLSKMNIRQLRIAETEKFAHVTYFFNGGKEGPYPKEERILIPSPRVKTYDTTPAMSANKITTDVVKSIGSGKYGVIVLNFANADMVGHTGELEPTVKAVECVDRCLGKVVGSARKNGYDVIVTADHGNAEEMAGRHRTSHTLNKVPFIILSDERYKIVERKNNSIANMSPTVLRLMGIKSPDVYAGSLVR
ncbi:2,3-bisphosphoglycerate-independent phosphoglycerate mutase [Candidatus Woesearchaeota archaeon]|nr:2,3-bisphosphoglycerate-independent phosphoglycerate mutase [Candidatus Woesearchaeota archaeon]